MIGIHFNSKGDAVLRRDEKPLRRKNPSGEEVWVARYTARDGKRRSGGTFEKCGPCKKRDGHEGRCCAQHRIWHMYENDTPAEQRPATVREYYTDTWLTRHPRALRVALNYRSRIKAVIDVPVHKAPKGAKVPFGDLAMVDVRPRHLDDLVDVMLREHGRAASGTRAVITTISAMFTDAIRDEVAEMNPALYVKVRDSDPRVQRPKRKRGVIPWETMHAFAAAAGEGEPAVRVLADCGLRLGELLGLECKHVRGDVLVVEQQAWRGVICEGTKQSDQREVPLPPVVAAMLAEAKRGRIGVLFPNPKGGPWHSRAFYREVWYPACDRYGVRFQCHDFRHAFVSLMRAAGVDPADLAVITGHTVQTATTTYTHSTGATFELVRRAVGE